MKKRGQCLGSQIATYSEMQSYKFMQWPNPLQQTLSIIFMQRDTSSYWSLQHISKMTGHWAQNDSLSTEALLVYW